MVDDFLSLIQPCIRFFYATDSVPTIGENLTRPLSKAQEGESHSYSKYKCQRQGDMLPTCVSAKLVR